MTAVIGYVRLSKEDKRAERRKASEATLSIDTQKASILAAIQARGWTLSRWAVDLDESGKPGADKPQLASARSSARLGETDGIVAVKLDRFARSIVDMMELVNEADNAKNPYRLVFLDMGGVDTKTAAGRMFVQMLAVFAEFERNRIAERTREALAELKAQGVTLGAPRQIPAEVEARIRELKAGGFSMRQIAGTLSSDGVRTVRGGEWSTSTIQAVLNRTP